MQPSLLPLMEGPAVIVPPVVPPSEYPTRIQRSRRRGAKTPEGAIYVGRPTMYANPFRSERFGHARSILMYGRWMEGRLSDLQLERHGFCPVECDALHRMRERIHRGLPRLHRRSLVCWCPLSSSWCHADILLRYANDDLPPGFIFENLPSPFAKRPQGAWR